MDSSDVVIVVGAGVLLVLALFVIAFPRLATRGRRLDGVFAGREVLFVRAANSLVALTCVVVILTHVL
jgi:hypothetical protein